MGLQTQLYALNDRVVTPGYRDDYEFDYEKQTIGETAYRVPLPWLAMFRMSDLVEETVDSELRKAPITTMAQAKLNLLQSAETLEQVFPKATHLGDYVRIMARELDLFDFKFVTIDATEMLGELNHGNPRGDEWEKVLQGFENPDSLAQIPLESSLIHLAFAALSFRLGEYNKQREKLQAQHPLIAAINQFTEFDPEEALLHPEDPEALHTEAHPRLLPGGVHHSSVWTETPTS